MVGVPITAIEGRVPYLARWTVEVSADKKQDIKERFQIVNDTMGCAMNKQLDCYKRSSPLHIVYKCKEYNLS